MAHFSTIIHLPFWLKTPKNVKMFLDCVMDLFPDEKIDSYSKHLYPRYKAIKNDCVCEFYSTNEFVSWVNNQNEVEIEYLQTVLEDCTSLQKPYSVDNCIRIECTDENRLMELKLIINQRLNQCKAQADIVPLPYQKDKKIFISHATEDKAYVKEIVELLIHMGVNKTEQIFCSSMEGTGIPLRSHIYDYIKEQFQNYDIIVIMVLSQNYYKSPACLNEMGATWIFELMDFPILLPGFDFSQINGAADPRNIAIKLDAEDAFARLNELRERVSKFFGIKISNETDEWNAWWRYQNDFLAKIKSIK